ncbi:MAG: hypothetical protein KVP17_003553 [Porospora cf. gigantea B]|uniref:uncharacterized protein n=1 Tax=Porospora cf. gigantea B TaxID=2853592 RepID=UPI003571CB16|nr:MAG: hypothetical protein KVP17_003553 [Porospora cf. gigantea B]
MQWGLIGGQLLLFFAMFAMPCCEKKKQGDTVKTGEKAEKVKDTAIESYQKDQQQEQAEREKQE